MTKQILTLGLFVVAPYVTSLQAASFKMHVEQGKEGYDVSFSENGRTLLRSPREGLWSVATSWKNDWMADWHHASPSQKQEINGWTILSGEITLPEGTMRVRDAIHYETPELVRCVRRYEWAGKDTLKEATLSVRYQLEGVEMKPFLPGILYYGNPAGAAVNSEVIPVYRGQAGEFAIFEDHRYPMPFAMIENASGGYAAAIHTTPSPVRGARLGDQWWSLGVEAFDGYSELVLYSGPIGYNRQHSVAKALQARPMRYTDTYLDMEPGRIVEKEFFVELYPVTTEGSGFRKPLYTSLELYKPYNAERFPAFSEIVKAKSDFAGTRWVEKNNVAGFSMYDLQSRKDFVMGWCGQAASPGFAFQWLGKYVQNPNLKNQIQRSLDFLSSYPIDADGGFPVGYNVGDAKYYGGDPVSCGQAMYNFAKAIESARKNKQYDTRKWEEFLKKACDGQASRILSDEWKPRSTAEGFLIAPLAIASKLFKNDRYKAAAMKAGDVFAERHLNMREPYWGGTLDATCEDKEGAWAAFQGFLELYERFGQKKHLDWASHAMDVCLSYVVVWDIPLPPGRLADHQFKSTGWTVVSPQNQHIDVFGVLFTPEIYKMGRLLRKPELQQLARVMYRSCFQLTDARGSQGEQLQQTNFAQHGDMSNVHKLRGGYSESWTVFWITAHFLNAAARFEEMNVEI